VWSRMKRQGDKEMKVVEECKNGEKGIYVM
jgi:hypothetical protein